MSNIATALSGLQNTSLAIDTVSNNIANANTIGYKAGEYVFATQFINGTNTSDQPAVGQGNQSLGVRRPMTQGTITNSANPLDLAISGKGMFRMLMGSGGSENIDPSAVYYSRNGQFGVDKQGYIVNENGMYLTGYQPSLDGTKVTDDLIKNNGLLKMPPANLPDNATSYSKLSTMLDSTATAFTPTANVAFDPGQSTYNNKTTQTVFDSDGNSHTLEVYYRRVSDTSLAITSGVNGFTYTPSSASTPNTVGDSNVVINKESVLRLNTAPKASALSSASTTGTAITLAGSPSNSGANVAVTGMKIYVNGVDSGATVSAQTGAAITASESILVPSGAAVSFYDGDNAHVTTAAPTNASTLTLTAAPSNVAVGDRLYMGGVDTGITVTAKSGNTVTLSSAVTSTSTAAVFKHSMAMTLIAPDGAEISVTGSTNKKASLEKLTTTMAQVEVFASIDGKFFDYQDASTFSNRKITAETPGVTGYKAVAKLNFVGGHNIDSMVTDPLSGQPMFKSNTQLSARLTNQAGGSADLLFNLDLSDTSLHAGSFQVTGSTQDGEAMARLSSVSVDGTGRIVGVYGSGKQQFVGQVALVSFDNDEGLIPVGKNAFTASVSSGTEQTGEGVTVGQPGEGILGEIRGQALEASNVDLANELVRLMILQRSYSANSQSLKAIDQTLRDTLQMVG